MMSALYVIVLLHFPNVIGFKELCEVVICPNLVM